MTWLISARVRRSRELLETTNLTMERVAEESGFATAQTFCQRRVNLDPFSPVEF
jgi:transcriptional regulator GlxA family with amidase domain